ncbi:MAG: DUF748 domain-containing protein, partial [Gammaproteobacteria bacterium]|nr:DUF748 domain-containing protein [Gammaproteobacteria bacterium]
MPFTVRTTFAPWLDWRRRRFWLVIALLVAYTLAGFFLVPWAARGQIVAWLQDELSLPVELAELRFNPWSLRAEANGFVIRETDDMRIVGFDRLVVNLQASSLFRWALVLREVTLEQPLVRLTRQPDGNLSIDPLIAAATGGDAAPTDEADDGGSLRLLIGELNIIDGRIEARDETLATPFATSVGPININVNDLTTLPDRAGQQRVSVATERGTQLEWNGTLELDPLISAGRVTGSGPYMPLLYQYFQDQLNFELTEGSVDLAFDYQLEIDPAAGLSVELSNANTTLRGATLQIDEPDGDASRFVTLPVVSMVNGTVAWPEQAVRIDTLEIVDADIAIWRDAGGMVNVQQLLVTETPPVAPDPGDAQDPAAAQEPAGDPDPADANVSPDPRADDSVGGQNDDAEPWDLSLGALRVDNLTLTLSDRSLPDDNAVVARNVNLDVRDISNELGQVLPFELAFALEGGGDVKLNGQASVLPTPVLQAQLDVTALSLIIAQPWLAAAVPLVVESGELDLALALSSTDKDIFSAKGSAKVGQLAVRDTLQDERLIGWQSMAIDQVAFSAAGGKLKVSRVAFDAPYA